MIKINEKDFNNWMKIKGLSERTKKEYNFYLNKCLYQELNQEDINIYLSAYPNAPAKALLRNLLTYIQTSNNFDKEIKLKAQEILINIPKQTGRKKKNIPDFLSYNEVLELANSMKKSRDRLIVLFLFTTGLRLDEFYSLIYSNFNFKEWLDNPKESGKCRFIGKGNKEAIVSIESEIMAGIVKYINESNGRSKSERVFKISKSGLSKLLTLNGLNILGKKVHPHTLRHSYATFLLSKDLDLMEVKELMRHESLVSTQVYLHINQEELKKKKSEAFN